ncbi:putative Aldose 1-epimerase [Zostera marina]|uniref:glucose-6-phosphate 1-epimerase n=1 Tax=Zostera marina TaxID=29655 RepID=A0A0K9NVM0_ZOSMR|nr:putative Aldose 1-epimerase [Zostera marina]
MTWGVINEGDGSRKIRLLEKNGTSAEILLHGGQVVSWKYQTKELLFISTKKIPKPSKVITGGMSISFPQCSASGSCGSLAQHNLVRNRLWELDDSCPSLPLMHNLEKYSSVDLVLRSTEEDLKIWPHRFELRLRVVLGSKKLILIPRVKNTDTKPFLFSFSIRNYLLVSDISEVRIEGLETLHYYDYLKQKATSTEQSDAITFYERIDRLYLRTCKKIAVIDHSGKQTLVIEKECLPDSGIWNPWIEKTKAIADLGDRDYKTMLCMKSAANEKQILLKPSEEWKCNQELSVVPSSYYSGTLDPEIVCGS